MSAIIGIVRIGRVATVAPCDGLGLDPDSEKQG